MQYHAKNHNPGYGCVVQDAKGGTPDPARNPYSDEAIEARYHTTVIAVMALERAWVIPGAAAEELSLAGLR